MPFKTPKNHPKHLGRYFGLLLSLSIILVILPFAERGQYTLFVLPIALVVAMAFAILAAGRNRTQFIIATTLALPNIALTLFIFAGWFGLGKDMESKRLIAPFFAGFWFYVTLVIFGAFLKETHFTRDKVCGAICVFLLIGITWASLYMSVQMVLPESFIVTSPGNPPVLKLTPTQAVYFSFLTMSTMGYGDIAPNNNIVRTVAYSQAIVGVLFIAVFIARVVSLYEQHHRKHGGDPLT